MRSALTTLDRYSRPWNRPEQALSARAGLRRVWGYGVVSRTLQKLAARDWPLSATSCYIPWHRWRRVPPGFKGESMHKRALGAAAVTGVAALALSACGGSSPTTPSNTGAADTSKATTTGTPETPSGTAAPVRDANVDLVIWTDADRSKAVQKDADQFAAENGVSVKVQIATDTR